MPNVTDIIARVKKSKFHKERKKTIRLLPYLAPSQTRFRDLLFCLLLLLLLHLAFHFDSSINLFNNVYLFIRGSCAFPNCLDPAVRVCRSFRSYFEQTFQCCLQVQQQGLSCVTCHKSFLLCQASKTTPTCHFDGGLYYRTLIGLFIRIPTKGAVASRQCLPISEHSSARRHAINVKMTLLAAAPLACQVTSVPWVVRSQRNLAPASPSLEVLFRWTASRRK